MKNLPDHILKERVNAYLNSRNISDQTISKLNIDEMIHEIMVYHEELSFQNDELQNTEQKCIRLKNEYDTVLDLVDDIVLFVNDDYEIIRANNSFYKKTHHDPLTTNRKDFRMIFNQDDQDLLFHGLKQLYGEDGQCEVNNLRLKNSDELYKLRCKRMITSDTQSFYILVLI